MFYRRLILLVFIIILTTRVVYAQNQHTLELKLGQLNGNSTYTITGPENGSWKSKLCFPLKTRIFSLNYCQQLETPIWSIQKIDFSLLKNIATTNNGLMKDTDWLYGLNKKDIYSETKADLEALSYKVEFNSPNHYYTENINYKLISGYKYNNFKYNIHDGFQYNYNTNNKTKLTGKVLNYEVKYHIPYIGVEFLNINNQLLNWNTNFNLAPYIKVEDIDDHLLRSKKSIGVTEGWGIMLNGALKYNLKSNLILSIAGEYSNLNSDGHQDQHFYDGTYKGQRNENIAQTINLESYKFSATISYLF